MQPTTRSALGETLDNQRIMKLVEEALGRPEAERERFLKEQCGNLPDFEQAWHYVEWEQRMQGFLLEPVIKRDEEEVRFKAGDLLHNRFQIVREVAQGGMGVVYEALDQKLGRRIALKCAKAGFGIELPPEVRNATEISHPNVCKIYEIHTATVGQQLVDFITMEFLDGETLASRLARGRVPKDETMVIARQLAAGLAAAHRNGVIHGDIKGNNVILTKGIDGGLRAVITDFGLARGQGSQSRGIWGTPGYMAPELWMGEEPSAASDIYALGVVFHEMATGEIPNQSQTSKAKTDTLKATAWLDAASHKPLPVNSYWDGIFRRCLDANPKKRYRSADDLAAALAPRHIRRNALLATAAVVVAALTGVVTYRSAMGPTETVTMAILSNGDFAEQTLIDAEHEIARLEGNKKTRFEVLPAGNSAKATHQLRLSTTKVGEKTLVRAILTDASVHASLKTWEASYSAEDWKYLPQALAGVVSSGLHLGPLPETRAVSSQAASQYLAGINATRLDATIDEGLKELASAAAIDRDSALIYAALAEGDWLKSKTNADKAWVKRSADAAEQAEIRYPDTVTGHRIEGILKQAAGRFDDAEAEYLRAIELEPDNAENYRVLGIFYEHGNQFNKALAALSKAVDLEPGFYKNQKSFGEFYLQQGKYGEAVHHLSEAVRLVPGAAAARLDLAMAYTDTGEFGKAEQNVRVLLKPGGPILAQFQFAKIRMYQGKDKEAVPLLLAVVKDAPDNYVYWMHLGIAERRIGQMAESRGAIQKAKELVEPEIMRNLRDGDPRSFLSYFCAQLGDKPRALWEAKQALQLAPQKENVIWNTALTYESLEMRDNAIEVLEKAAPETLADLKRWPDMAELTADSRFIRLTASKAAPKERRK